MNMKEIVAASTNCAACKQINSPEAKFCKGCGHHLYEPCAGCTQPVLLEQKFCGKCGTDLERIAVARKQKHKERLADAVAAAKEQDFESALELLRTIAEVQDYRFRSSAETARKAISQVETLRDQALSKADRKITQALSHYGDGELSDVVKLLKNVPEKLLTEEARKIYLESKASLEQLQSLEKEFVAASQNKDWIQAGILVEQLQQALPNDRVYEKTSIKLAAKLYAAAETLFASQKYAAAAKRLAAIPEKHQSSKVKTLSESIQATLWLKSILQLEPFATPTLGRLALRLSKLVPDDAEATRSVKEIADVLKRKTPDPHNHVPKWSNEHAAWTGGDFCYFAKPTKIGFDENNDIFRSNPGRFGVAIGLAIQGLGQARIAEEYSGIKKKKGLFSRKQIQPCWGLDIGSQSVKAVRMELTENQLHMTDFFFHEFDSAMVKSHDAEESVERIAEVVNRWKETCECESATIWCNLPNTEVTTRFVRLPPMDDKKIGGLINKEIESRIPIPLDELSITKSVGELDKGCSYGRPFVFSAARTLAVKNRLEFIEKVGIQPDGLQSDGNAFVNLIAWEFADQLSDFAPETPKAEDSGQSGSEESDPTRNCTPTIAWIDAGASTTTLIYVSGETHWFWSIECGGDDLTRALARSVKKNHLESEKLKTQPDRIEMPAEHFAAVESRMDELRQRFQKFGEEAIKQNDRFNVANTFVSGGAALTISWIRRVIGRNS